MSNASDLALARSALVKRKFEIAIPILQRLIDENTEEKAVAAYCLAVCHGDSNPIAKDEAKVEYYLAVAEDCGHLLGTYAMAGIFHHRGELSEALERFKRIADHLPSASYWAYRILKENQELIEYEGEVERYWSLAIEQGHLLARRDEFMLRIKGRKGLTRIPGGIVDFFRWLIAGWRAITSKDKYLWT